VVPYTQPTVCSVNRRASPSPRKTPSASGQPIWLIPSPIPGRELSTSPVKPLSRVKPGSRIPQPGFLLPSVKPSPSPITTNKLRTPVPGFKQNPKFSPSQVYSPVAEYVRNNPAPHLVRNVIARETRRDLESTMMEVEDKENKRSLPPCPLPANTYSTAGLNKEIQIDGTGGREYHYIPEAYGQQINTDARVTKHISRKKVEETQRTSSMDTNTLEMSLLETKVVRKFATPLQRLNNLH